MAVKVFSRMDMAKAFGRRVSRGEFERAFTRYRWGLKKWDMEEPYIDRRIKVLHPDSPKFKRKHSDTLTQTKSRRARFI